MKRPTIFSGIGLAFGCAVFTLPLWWGFPPFLGTSTTIRYLSAGLYVAYTVYLVRSRGSRVGAITQVSVNLLLATTLVLCPIGTRALIGSLIVLISLNRSLLFHRNVVACAADGLLAVCGLSFASYLFFRAGSLPTAAWGFFLVQSLFALIPSHLKGVGGLQGRASDDAVVDAFVRSQRQAEAALERIIQTDG